MSSSVSPFATRSRNSAVRARSASSDSAFVPASSALTFTTTFLSRRSSASLESKMRPRTLKRRPLGDRQRHLRPGWIEERAHRFAFVDPADRLPDDADDLAATAVVAVRLLHEHERDVQHLADPACLVRIAEVGYDEGTLVGRRLHDRAQVLDEQVARRELVTGDAEKALDLHLVH